MGQAHSSTYPLLGRVPKLYTQSVSPRSTTLSFPPALWAPQARELQGAAGHPHMSMRPNKESKSSWCSPGFPAAGFIQEFGKGHDGRGAAGVPCGQWACMVWGAVGGPGLEEGM